VTRSPCARTSRREGGGCRRAWWVVGRELKGLVGEGVLKNNSVVGGGGVCVGVQIYFLYVGGRGGWGDA
jgi:hypothetical protein